MNALQHTLLLAGRALRTAKRQPFAWFPSLFFPLILMAIFTGSFGAATQLPGFPPVRGFLDFAVSGAILQGVLIGGTSAGAAFATDLEGGFLDRLIASPVSRTAILTGRLVGSMAQGVIQALLFVGIAVAFGARMAHPVAGLFLMLLFAALLAAAVAGLGVMLALRTGSSEAVQGTFPLFFILLFFSSAFFPRETMPGLFKTIADWNPVSHIVEGMRAQVIGGDWARPTLVGLALCLALIVLTVGASQRALARRLAEAS